MYRRREFVDREVTRIDDADAIPRQEPQFAIGGLSDDRVRASTTQIASNSIRAVENRAMDRPLRIGKPRVELGLSNAHQTTARINPERLSVVSRRPANSVAGQSVLDGRRANTAVFYSAEPALSRGPDRTVSIKLKVDNAAPGQSIGACV